MRTLLETLKTKIPGGRDRLLNELIKEGLPPAVIPAARFLLDRTMDADSKAVEQKVERERARIADQGEQKVSILYSPRPGSAGEVATEELRPEHGELMEFTMAQVARTGKKQPWGTVLYLLAREAKARAMLELGACAGISASYLASAPTCESLITIEGSPALARLAQETLSRTAPQASVVANLFDDALDTLLTPGTEIDLLFIDGHHEKIATIHYWQRVRPFLRKGAMVLFDDISWSQDMRDGWHWLSEQDAFSHAVDFGLIGVCFQDGRAGVKPKKWDLREITGVKEIGKPHGWSK